MSVIQRICFSKIRFSVRNFVPAIRNSSNLPQDPDSAEYQRYVVTKRNSKMLAVLTVGFVSVLVVWNQLQSVPELHELHRGHGQSVSEIYKRIKFHAKRYKRKLFPPGGE